MTNNRDVDCVGHLLSILRPRGDSVKHDDETYSSLALDSTDHGCLGHHLHAHGHCQELPRLAGSSCRSRYRGGWSVPWYESYICNF